MNLVGALRTSEIPCSFQRAWKNVYAKPVLVFGVILKKIRYKNILLKVYISNFYAL